MAMNPTEMAPRIPRDLRVVGRPAGNVRSPLTALRPPELEELRKLIERAQKNQLSQIN
jgi:hypothetical protein